MVGFPHAFWECRIQLVAFVAPWIAGGGSEAVLGLHLLQWSTGVCNILTQVKIGVNAAALEDATCAIGTPCTSHRCLQFSRKCGLQYSGSEIMTSINPFSSLW